MEEELEGLVRRRRDARSVCARGRREGDEREREKAAVQEVNRDWSGQWREKGRRREWRE
jgi:hypothetical protein